MLTIIVRALGAIVGVLSALVAVFVAVGAPARSSSKAIRRNTPSGSIPHGYTSELR